MENILTSHWHRSFFNFTIGLISIMIVAGGCKSQRNVVKSEDGKLSVDKETIVRDLTAIIDPGSELTGQEKRALLTAIKGHSFQDAQVDSLIIVAENSLNTAANVPLPPEPEPVVEEETDPGEELEGILTDQFDALINPEMEGNSEDIIVETLTHFESNDAPVLIILEKTNGKVFYDRPTTIKKYLYYLKDLKKNHHRIEEMDLNHDDKINKLILASR